MQTTLSPKQRGSRTLWLDAALALLAGQGIEAVKIMPLANRLGLTRTGFYWHFASRDALLEAMIHHWEEKNTGNLEARCAACSASICEAVFNLFDCWIDTALFDAPLDLAIRNWARNAPDLQTGIEAADSRRLTALKGMFLRHGYPENQANARALTMLYTQIGYISLRITEPLPDRIKRMPDYAEVYTGQKPAPQEIARLKARHGIWQLVLYPRRLHRV